MNGTILFCAVFLSQVLLISWVYPRRVIRRVRYVLQKFPPATHPKGYSQPLEYYERLLGKFARINLVVVATGLLIIGLILATLFGGQDLGIFTSSRKQNWDKVIILPFFLVQLCAAWVYMSVSRSRRLRLSKIPPPRVRTTELRRRQLVDFVSPVLLAVAVVTNVAFIAFMLACQRRLELPEFKVVALIVSVAVTVIGFSVTVGIALRAPKANPYQAQQDRLDQMKLVAQQALVYCIALPLLFTALLTIKLVEPRLLYATLASLFCQGIALAFMWPIFSYRLDKVDFDVYKQDTPDLAPGAPAR